MTDILKGRFRHNQFEKPQMIKHLSKLNSGALGAERPSTWRFLKIYY